MPTAITGLQNVLARRRVACTAPQRAPINIETASPAQYLRIQSYHAGGFPCLCLLVRMHTSSIEVAQTVFQLLSMIRMQVCRFRERCACR